MAEETRILVEPELLENYQRTIDDLLAVAKGLFAEMKLIRDQSCDAPLSDSAAAYSLGAVAQISYRACKTVSQVHINGATLTG